MEKIREISREYFENDPSVQHLIQFLRHSEEIESAWRVFKSSSEIEDIIAWMNSHGVHIAHELLAISNHIEGILPMHLRSNLAENFSLKTYEKEVKEQIKFDEMNVLIDELLANGDDFAHLYLILRVSRPALERLFLSDEIKEATEHLTEHGVDVENLKLIVYEILRWK